MRLSTTRFGDIDIDESRAIMMKAGILGFEHLKRYVLLVQDEEILFWWFQSVDDGSVAFVVINPFVIKPDYKPIIQDNDVELLEIESPEDVILMSIVTIRSDPFRVTANLRAPIVINLKKRLAKQIILDKPDYPIQYSMMDNKLILGEESYKKEEIIASALSI
ncbi:MAG: flagellar assembly protein FliW [Deltaproteobacteria bacterium]|nr:flagellar assembly protein FliW [Methanophagales archaeon]PXF50492.1 MAG: flagellar assembly protein FliW [Deltaproteobacteria bacterium]